MRAYRTNQVTSKAKIRADGALKSTADKADRHVNSSDFNIVKNINLVDYSLESQTNKEQPESQSCFT